MLKKHIATIAALAAAMLTGVACGPPNVVIDLRNDGGVIADAAAPTPDAQPAAECIRHSDCALGLECASGRCVRQGAVVDAGVADTGASADSGAAPQCTPTNEVCDGRDNDCDNVVDEGCPQPGRELCNGVDDDGDNLIDEGLENLGVCIARVAQAANAVSVPGKLRCENGRVACVADCRSGELCNGLDDDCDGVVDEGCAMPDAGTSVDGGTSAVDGGIVDSGYVRTGTGTLYLVIEYEIPAAIQTLLSGPRLGSQARGGWTYDDLQIVSGGATGIRLRAAFYGVVRSVRPIDFNTCFRFCSDVTLASGGGEWLASAVLRVPPIVRAGTNPNALAVVPTQSVDNGRGGRNERVVLSAVP